MIETDERGAPLPALTAWLREGARSAFGGRPRWDGLRATPWIVAALVLLSCLLSVAIERLYVDGPALFYWRAIEHGWLGTLVTLWLCWFLLPRVAESPAAHQAPGAAALFAMLVAQAVVLVLVTGAVTVSLMRLGRFDPASLGRTAYWLAAWLPLAWHLGAGIGLIVRSTTASAPRRALAVLAFAAPFSLWLAGEPVHFWYPQPDARQGAGDAFELTQEVIERQPVLLAERLDALQKQRPGRVDLYAITFAPYADESVFRQEGALVSRVLQERFDAGGRVVELANDRAAASDWPWATPPNLQRAIARAAAQMDRDEDILFIHLTSHGARNGELAASFYPLQVAPLTPALLRQWLDAAGVRFRVISISACYAGSWIAPLADPGTLVMTAADAEHTSYGCGRGSELTFFGRAMFDEQLRRTHSFEDAHREARGVIERREREAGKSDGYSNPQLSAGPGIRERLARLEVQLAASR
jgi:hypothetical protein